MLGFRHARRAAATIEFALIAPLFIYLYVVGSDVVLAMRNRFRLDEAAAQVLQITSQYIDFYESDFTGTLFPIAQNLVGNKAGTQNALACGVVISGVAAGNGTTAGTISWQRTTGTCAATASRLGAPNRVATFPGGYVPPSTAPMIVVEIVTRQDYTGLSATLLGASTDHYDVAVAMPRQRILPTISSGTRP